MYAHFQKVAFGRRVFFRLASDNCVGRNLLGPDLAGQEFSLRQTAGADTREQTRRGNREGGR